MVELLPATRSDMVKFYGRVPPSTLHAVKWLWHGEIVAIAGYTKIGEEHLIFSDIKEGANPPAIRVWKEAVKFMKKIPKGVCVTQDSGEFLERLGWVKTETEGVYSWQG